MATGSDVVDVDVDDRGTGGGWGWYVRVGFPVIIYGRNGGHKVNIYYSATTCLDTHGNLVDVGLGVDIDTTTESYAVRHKGTYLFHPRFKCGWRTWDSAGRNNSFSVPTMSVS